MPREEVVGTMRALHPDAIATDADARIDGDVACDQAARGRNASENVGPGVRRRLKQLIETRELIAPERIVLDRGPMQSGLEPPAGRIPYRPCLHLLDGALVERKHRRCRGVVHLAPHRRRLRPQANAAVEQDGGESAEAGCHQAASIDQWVGVHR